MRRNQNRGKEKEEQLATTIKNQQLHVLFVYYIYIITYTIDLNSIA